MTLLQRTISFSVSLGCYKVRLEINLLRWCVPLIAFNGVEPRTYWPLTVIPSVLYQQERLVILYRYCFLLIQSISINHLLLTRNVVR
jgi:hypothetical protein